MVHYLYIGMAQFDYNSYISGHIGPHSSPASPPSRSDAVRLRLARTYETILQENKDHLHEDLHAVAQGFLVSGGSYKIVSKRTGLHYDTITLPIPKKLDSFIKILSKNNISSSDATSTPFEMFVCAPARGRSTSPVPPLCTDCFAVLVSQRDKKIKEDGIAFVFINDVFSELIPLLQELFPQYFFSPLSEQDEILAGR